MKQIAILFIIQIFENHQLIHICVNGFGTFEVFLLSYNWLSPFISVDVRCVDLCMYLLENCFHIGLGRGVIPLSWKFEGLLESGQGAVVDRGTDRMQYVRGIEYLVPLLYWRISSFLYYFIGTIQYRVRNIPDSSYKESQIPYLVCTASKVCTWNWRENFVVADWRVGSTWLHDTQDPQGGTTE